MTPLELWAAQIDGRSIFAWQSEPAFPDALVGLVQQHTQAEQVYLSGGGAMRVGLAESLRAAGIRVVRPQSPRFAAARAGSTLVDGSALCADIGQTSIKLTCGDAEQLIERDFARAPFRDDVPAERMAAARASTVSYLAEILAKHCSAVVTNAVVALPCTIDADGVAGGCTYAWDQQDETLLDELVAGAELPCTLVLNDAELAAVAAAAEPSLPAAPTLVLTLGFGVGGALWVPA